MAKFKQRVTVKKSLSGERKFRKWEEYDIGDVLIGQYTGKTQEDNYGKQNYMIKVIDAQFKDGSGESLEGKTLVLNAVGVLDKNMEEVNEGEIIQLEYGGKSTIEKGKFKGKEAHTMKIDVVELDNDSSDDDL